MSLSNRIMSSFSFPSLFGSKTKSNQESRISKVTSQMRLAPFFVLSLLQQVGAASADKLYTKVSGLNVEVDYSASEFPGMRSALINYCNAIIYDVPQTLYSPADSPQCMSEDGVPGPTVELGVGVGQVLTEYLQECLNKGMKYMCDEYYSHHSPGTVNTDDETLWPLAIVGGCVVALACVGVCIAVGCRKSYGNSNSTTLPIYDASAPNYSTFSDYPQTPTYSAPILSPTVVVEADHHHHHHADTHHHSQPQQPSHHQGGGASVRWNKR